MRWAISKDLDNVSANQSDNLLDKGPAVTFAGTVIPKKYAYGPSTAENGKNSSEPSIIKTEGGYVSGIYENGIWVYLGIPYAAPPTGDLRWKLPEPAKPWEGILKAAMSRIMLWISGSGLPELGPNGGINTTWPRYNPEKDQYLEMGATHVIKNGY